MGDLDGRQTRPANDVGRPDGSAERAAVDSRTLSLAWLTVEAAAACWADDWDGANDAKAAEIRTALDVVAAALGKESALGQRQRGGQAPHGAAAPDAEAVEQ